MLTNVWIRLLVNLPNNDKVYLSIFDLPNRFHSIPIQQDKKGGETDREKKWLEN
jgi:hypothetical protein